MKYKNTTYCVSGRGRNAFVVEFFEVDFNVDEVVFVRLAVMNVEPDFRLKFLQDGTLQHEFMLCWNASAALPLLVVALTVFQTTYCLLRFSLLEYP